MKKEKINYQTEEQKEMQKFFLVVVGLVLVILGVYFLSKILIKPSIKEYEYTTGQVSTTAISVGTLLNAKEKSYYVVAYDFNSDISSSIQTYADHYTSTKENATKIYYLDLSTAFNRPYYVTEKSNPKATKIKDLKMLNGTLLLIKDGKITKYLEGLDAISKELKA